MTAEQIVDNPVPWQGVGGGLQEFRPGQGPAASSSVSPGHAGQGFFRTFPRDKKSPKSAPAAHKVHHVVRDDLGVQIMTDDDPYFWHRQEETAVWRMPPGTHPAWVRSRDGLFFHVESGQVLPSLSGSFGLCIGGFVVDVFLAVFMQRQAPAVLDTAWVRGCALTVVDVPLVRQRQVPTAFRVPLRVWNRSFLREASHCTHLDSGHYSYVLLVTGWHSAPVFSGQSVAASGRISDSESA